MNRPHSFIGAFLFLITIYLCGCCSQDLLIKEPTANKKYVRPEWFGAKNDGNTDCTEAIQKMFDYMYLNDIYVCKFKRCRFDRGEFYLISKTINIRKPVKIEGRKAFIASKDIIHFGDDPNHQFYYNNGRALNFIGVPDENPRLTDICINAKVHAKPFYFLQLKNAYIHDCYVSTYTGDTAVTKGVYTYWFAFQCNELSYAKFKNVHIDQPTSGNSYNSADGIHLSGNCHDIVIDNVYGQAGDDFIAMNTNENQSGDIFNVIIRNCSIGDKTISGSGIRFYGCSRLSKTPSDVQLRISNVLISKCNINTYLSPCIFFTNNPDWVKTDLSSQKLSVNNVTIKDCRLDYKSSRKKDIPSIWIGGVECNDLCFDKIIFNEVNENTSTLYGFEGYNEFNQLTISRNKQKKNNGLEIIVEDDKRMLEKEVRGLQIQNNKIILNQKIKKKLIIQDDHIVN